MLQKIALVFGTRPEAIKLAPLYLELVRRPDEFQPLIWVTAQHRQMLDQVLEVFGLHADRDFNLMRPGQSLTDVTINVLRAMEEAFAEERPDCVIVQGDTTTAFAAALAAYYQKIPIGHVEAGLRTGNKFAPYPEEMNRRLVTPLADLHFPPTERSRQNLLNEGIAADSMWVTGNTVIDALAVVTEMVRRDPPPRPKGFPEGKFDNGRRMVLITGHRRENFGSGFESICQAIAELAGRYPDCEFVYPVHLNPNVQEPVHRLLGGKKNIHLIKPLDYKPFAWAMDQCYFLLTDSGGVQEEAPYLGKPVLVMRETTERPEAVEAGTARLVGTDAERIVAEATRLMEEPSAYEKMSRAHNPFGDGKACRRIADVLAERFGE
ncbi:UDP-N-acetylglucosamine 2-epimerase (non-hydrolyzing) [bacterium]|nr:UDP-N-acetylglucosamine 2-epimerase (non-hydrolyzing) [bacterium]